MLTEGLVRSWSADEGWGVIDSGATPGGCWVHFSNIEARGFRSLEVNQPVNFTWEPVEQDGYKYRAVVVKGHP